MFSVVVIEQYFQQRRGEILTSSLKYADDALQDLHTLHGCYDSFDYNSVHLQLIS